MHDITDSLLDYLYSYYENLLAELVLDFLILGYVYFYLASSLGIYSPSKELLLSSYLEWT